MPFRRRTNNPGAWHHYPATTLVNGAFAANHVSSLGLYSPSQPGTLRALDMDIYGYDTSNSNTVEWSVLVVPNGVGVPADPTGIDAYGAMYWLSGADSYTTMKPFCDHVQPKSSRRMQAGDAIYI